MTDVPIVDDDENLPPLKPFCAKCGRYVDEGLLLCERCATRPPVIQATRTRVPWTIDLRSIMLVIVWIAIGLTLLLQNATALFGIVILLIVPATLIRTSPIMIDAKRRGRNVDPGVYLTVLSDSCCVVFLLLVAASIAFVSVCTPLALIGFTPTVDGNVWFQVACCFGLLAAVIVLYLVGRRTFPPKGLSDADTSRPYVPRDYAKPLSRLPELGAGEDHHEGETGLFP